MYTELRLKAKLLNNNKLNNILIKEEIMGEKEGRCPLLGGSAYFDDSGIEPSLKICNQYSILEGTGNIKNYKYEIEELLEKIKPYVIEWEGYIHYEKYENPNTILIMENGKPIIKDTDEKIVY